MGKVNSLAASPCTLFRLFLICPRGRGRYFSLGRLCVFSGGEGRLFLPGIRNKVTGQERHMRRRTCCGYEAHHCRGPWVLRSLLMAGCVVSVLLTGGCIPTGP